MLDEVFVFTSGTVKLSQEKLVNHNTMDFFTHTVGSKLFTVSTSLPMRAGIVRRCEGVMVWEKVTVRISACRNRTDDVDPELSADMVRAPLANESYVLVTQLDYRTCNGAGLGDSM
jgi:hypothetical protein